MCIICCSRLRVAIAHWKRNSKKKVSGVNEYMHGLLLKLRRIFIGDSRNVTDPSIFHKLSLIAFFAWVGLGADGLSSSCYGPEEAFLALGSHHYLGIFVAVGVIITITIISISYHYIIELFPSGGGGYLVASKLLSPTAGMVSGCALLIDYLLTITLSVASGADALFSFIPYQYHYYKIYVAIGGVIVLTILNLRGVKESIAPLVPVFIIFLATHLFVIIYAILNQVVATPEFVNNVIVDVGNSRSELGTVGMLVLILKAYSMGAGTFTGIEAVSNGIPLLREPKVHTAKKTMNYMAISLSIMAGGLMIAYLLMHVEHVPGRTLNAVLFETVSSSWPSGIKETFIVITLLSEAALLFFAAQTGFLDGPRILANMAIDRFMPTRFASLSDRLVMKNGILLMGIASIILMIYSGGSVKLLVIFYSINVFITFSLSQLGMLRHWWMVRQKESYWKRKFFVNGTGLILTSFILFSVIFLKFSEGGWMTIFITGFVVITSIIIKKHYNDTANLLGRLQQLVDLVKAEESQWDTTAEHNNNDVSPIDSNSRVAALFVNGFSGMGLHTLFSIQRLFPGMYNNFIFIQVGIVDSGMFKGAAEINKLREHCNNELDRYVAYMRKHGYNAIRYFSIGVDVVEESVAIAKEIISLYPNTIFFAGQLVFPQDTFLSRLLHNYTAFAIQREFYHRGMPILILPIRL
ncbi:MAG: APC family permease [Spirochaetes bacterium]|nr:APC family permease [Spirochaetota bacterium]